MKKFIKILLIWVILIMAIFFIGRYGWKLAGFSVCESAGIEEIVVTDDEVRIKGFYPGSFPHGFIGYYAKEDNGTLYVGFKFGTVFGIFETGDFDISIPAKEKITRVVIKSGNSEYERWPDNEMASG